MSGRGFKTLTLAVGIGVIGSVGLLWELEVSRSLAREVERLERARDEALAQLRHVQVAVSYLSRSERVTRIAAERLGMTFPEERPALAYLWGKKVEEGYPEGLASVVRRLFGEGAFAEVRVRQ
ncbi:MAG: hypothetical protein DRP95_03020 [Candidatus Latescibacterota bacterium]|nr:MAG: hypothetical protein DRP95_03020 [Candidatus Latescibacterota bacterium]